MTVKLEGDLDILKMYPHTEKKLLAYGIQNLEFELLKKYENISQGQNVKSSKLL